MKVLDLFSGIGGFSLGLERAGMETIAFCEFDAHARAVLKKHWPDVKIHEDVRLLDATEYRGTVDVVCGGFPCQDLSISGKQDGFDGDRSSLYKQMLRIISECLPRYAIFENVSGLITGDNGRWFAKFLYDLAEIGLDAEWHCISAAYVGAIHHRDRVWIIAYPANRDDGTHNPLKARGQEQESGKSISGVEIPAHPESKHSKRCGKVAHLLKQQTEFRRGSENFRDGFDLTEPALRGADDGVSRRMDRLRLARLGNAVVPQIPEMIGRAIMGAAA
ncbi:MAG: DNA cytosine methyltransferase [Gammaproteobacteria bacterium]|nr:DNA cytosine methyltransferase [Gammaproteobacteria bacterium]